MVPAAASSSSETATVGAASSGAVAIIGREKSGEESCSHDAPNTVPAKTAVAAIHGPRRIAIIERRSWSNCAVSSTSSGRFGSSSMTSSSAAAACFSFLRSIARRAASIRRSTRRRFARCSNFA